MQLGELNNAYNAAKRRIRSAGVGAVGGAEQVLGELLPRLQSQEDRRVATMLIARLSGDAVPTEPPSALMREAVAIDRAANEATGTEAERIGILAEARRKIFEIADRTGHSARLRPPPPSVARRH